MRLPNITALALAALLLPATGAGALPERIGRPLTLDARPFTPGLLLGTTKGLFRLLSTGKTLKVPHVKGPVIRLVRDSLAGNRLLAATGEGLLRSEDSGTTWKTVATFTWPQGALPVIALKPGNGDTLWRAGSLLERSDDGGRSWRTDGVVPRQVFDLLATAAEPARLYAATRGGLLLRQTADSEWTLAHPAEAPATLVRTLPDGQLYTFIVGVGLLRRGDNGAKWQLLASPFGSQFPVDLVSDGRKLYALTNGAKVLESGDDGATWRPLGGEPEPANATVREGRALYREHCQECHGHLGMGETLTADPSAATLAPALDDSAHAWHHTDQQLVAIILDGSPDNARMEGWKNRLSSAQAHAIVSYIKTLWSARILACQGPRHMQCR